MTAKIIQLPNAKRSQVRCPETDVIFPQVFRLTGFGLMPPDGKFPDSSIVDNMDEWVPNISEPIPPSYTLDMERVYGIMGNPKWEPIQYLDPSVDDGNVYIRHHKNREMMEGYVDALFDTETFEIEDRFLSFSTDFGYFSVLHRKANRQALNCALVYTTKIADPVFGGTLDWFKVIGPDGKEGGPDDLLPPEVNERYSDLHEMVNEGSKE